MANVRAYRSGNWSDTNLTTSPWSNGTALFVPNAQDVVYANNHRIQIDTNVKVISVRLDSTTAGTVWKDGSTGAAVAGGYFYLGNNVIFEGNVLARFNGGGTPTMYLSGSNSATIVGALSGVGSGSGNNGYAVSTTVDSVGKLTVIGSIYGGISNSNYESNGLYIQGVGITVDISGFLYGGRSGFVNQAAAVRNVSGYSRVFITGELNGGLDSFSPAYQNGNSNTTYIVGNIKASDNCNAIINTSYRARIYVSGNILSKNDYLAINSPLYYINPVPKDSYISFPISGNNVQYYFTADSLSAFSVPPASSVRLGISYANDTVVGSCVIPSISSVSLGVPFDADKVGISLLNPFDFFKTNVLDLTASNTIGQRLTNLSPIQSVGAVAASFSV